jgi:hypothetical protein
MYISAFLLIANSAECEVFGTNRLAAPVIATLGKHRRAFTATKDK